MAIVLDGTSGITTPEITSSGGPLVVNASAPDNSVVVDASGNVGLGVTPSAWSSAFNPVLQIETGALTGSGTTNFRMFANTYYDGSYRYIGTGRATQYEQDGYHAWYTAASGTAGNAISFTQAMTLDSSGNLLVGTTSASETTLGAWVNKDANSGRFTAVGNNSTSGATFLGVRSSDGAAVFIVRPNGNVLNANNSYGAVSDVKLKENIVDATPKLEKLNQVRVVNYNLIGSEQKQLGVIAQELEQIFPGMVEESPDRDAEGNDLGTTTKSVKYSVFVPMLIKAIQEQQALIASQSEIISAQQTALTALTARVEAQEVRLTSLEGAQA